MAVALPFIAIGLAAAGTYMGYAGQKKAGRAEARRAAALYEIGNFEAAQLEQDAGQQVAAAQRVAMEEERNAKLAQSRALALAAASGGGASDPTVMNILANLAGEGEYRSNVALYEGEERARKMRLGAFTRRYEAAHGLEGGLASARAYDIGATSTLLTGAGRIFASPTLMQKYGGNGPPSVSGGGGSFESVWGDNPEY